MSSAIESLVNREYAVRLRHRHRDGHAAAGSQRGRRPADLPEEERAAVHARVAAQGVSALAHDEGAALAERQVPADRLSGHRYYSAPEEREAAPEPRRGRSRAAPDLREARHPAHRAEDARRRGGRRDLRLRLGRHDDEGRAREARHHLLLVRRSGAGSSGARARSISAPSCRTATTSSPR